MKFRLGLHNGGARAVLCGRRPAANRDDQCCGEDESERASFNHVSLLLVGMTPRRAQGPNALRCWSVVLVKPVELVKHRGVIHLERRDRVPAVREPTPAPAVPNGMAPISTVI